MTILPVHVTAGVLALVFGYVALYAAKGATLHRKSGLLFVCAIAVMSVSGALIAFLKNSSISVVAGLLTFYFATTALLTVRPRVQKSQWIDAVAMLFALTIALFGFKTGFEISKSGRPETIPMFIFGGVGLLGVLGDVRMMRGGGIQGPRRIARHLWRMCFAMWVAAASFFWGPRGRVPEIIYYPALFPIPVLAPIVVMLFWLWRVRIRRSFRGSVGVSVPGAALEARPFHVS